ncbi:hypothetical protein C444_20786, partial [Haloarcula japonica DSM 6131]
MLTHPHNMSQQKSDYADDADIDESLDELASEETLSLIHISDG